MSLHMKGAQDVQCRFIVSGAGAQKVEYARLYRKMAAILTLQVFYVKLLSLSPSFPASYGGACFKSQHFVGRGWKDQGFYASLGYTLGSRPSWNLLTLSLTYVFIWGHTVLVLLFEYATSHTSSRVKDLFLQDGLLSGDWLLRAIFMNVWMCWWAILWTLLGDGGNSRGGCEDIACRLYFALSYCCSTLLPVGREVRSLSCMFSLGFSVSILFQHGPETWNHVTIYWILWRPWAKIHLLSFTFASFKYFGHRHTKVTNTYDHRGRKEAKECVRAQNKETLCLV